MLLLRIIAPQVFALVTWALVRASGRERDRGIAQLFAIAIAAASAWWLGIARITGMRLETWTRIGAFVALEIFGALLAQLLIVAARNE